jgi:hypothetical protein
MKYLEKYKIDKYRVLNRKNKEFYYYDDLTENELEEFKNEKKLYCDPGKTKLLYILNDSNGKFMSYTSKERKFDMNTSKYIYNNKKLNDNLGITESNEKLKNINRRVTHNVKNIKDNQKIINEEYEKMFKRHKSKKFLKEKFQRYMSKQKSETKMINKIEKQLKIKNRKELGEYTLVLGDWGGNNKLKNSQSTLGKGMRSILKKYFKKMYLLDETRTSKLSNITHEETKEHIMDLLIYTDKEKMKSKVITKKMHGILSFEMEKKAMTCKSLHNDENEKKVKTEEGNEKVMVRRFIKRDKNAVLNFKFVTEYYLNNNRTRHQAFIRKKN